MIQCLYHKLVLFPPGEIRVGYGMDTLLISLYPVHDRRVSAVAAAVGAY
jgi:hypothetical protein